MDLLPKYKYRCRKPFGRFRNSDGGDSNKRVRRLAPAQRLQRPYDPSAYPLVVDGGTGKITRPHRA